MGRAFEYRKARKFARWDKMSKAFTRLGKEIAMSVRQGGPVPETNPRLRAAIQNAKHVNMPKDRIEAAIKRASAKDEKDFEEIVYEGYGPHGVAIVVETATDNPMRTVANVRMYFNRGGGSLGKTGSLEFLFDRKGHFQVDGTGLDPEELELDLIDYGAEELWQDDEGTIHIFVPFAETGNMQKALEEKGIVVKNTELVRIPTSYAPDLTPEQAEEIYELVDKIEQDDDVQQVFHNMREPEEEA